MRFEQKNVQTGTACWDLLKETVLQKDEALGKYFRDTIVEFQAKRQVDETKRKGKT